MKKVIRNLALAFTVFGLVSVARADKARDASPMVQVPAGPFLMGADGGLKGEEPARAVELAAFAIDRHEVTNAQYAKFLSWVQEHGDRDARHPDQPAEKDHTPRYWRSFRPRLLKKTGMAALQRFKAEDFKKDDHPVVGVDWFDAYAYAKWAGKRLPTEAEWEKAARGTDGRTWPWGNEWSFENCNSGGYEWKGERDGHIYSAPVISYPAGASPYGCLNMAGNVWEWVADAPSGVGRAANPRTHRVLKGGGSNSYPSWVRPAARKTYEPEYRFFCLGFRCAKDVPQKSTEGAR